MMTISGDIENTVDSTKEEIKKFLKSESTGHNNNK